MKATVIFSLFCFGLITPVLGQADQFPGYADSVRRADVATTENGTVAEVLGASQHAEFLSQVGEAG